MPLFHAAVAVALACQSMAGPHPNFSGTWAMDPTRSESAAQERPVGQVTLSIAQTDTSLSIETTRDGHVEATTYPIGETPQAVTELTGERHAFWQGPRLVNEGSVDIGGHTVAFREARLRGGSDREMVVETTLKVQHGYEQRGAQTIVTGRDVYIRAR